MHTTQELKKFCTDESIAWIASWQLDPPQPPLGDGGFTSKLSKNKQTSTQKSNSGESDEFWVPCWVRIVSLTCVAAAVGFAAGARTTRSV